MLRPAFGFWLETLPLSIHERVSMEHLSLSQLASCGLSDRVQAKPYPDSLTALLDLHFQSGTSVWELAWHHYNTVSMGTQMPISEQSALRWLCVARPKSKLGTDWERIWIIKGLKNTFLSDQGLVCSVCKALTHHLWKLMKRHQNMSSSSTS